MYRDYQHLKLLSFFHFVVGILAILTASVFLGHLYVGLMMIFSPTSFKGAPPPPLMGWAFAILGGGAVLLGWTFGIALMVAGWFLRRLRHRTYCLVMAGLALFFQPFGSVLGAFTIVVLLRPSVKHLFATGELPYDPEDDETARPFDERVTADSYNIHSRRR